MRVYQKIKSFFSTASIEGSGLIRVCIIIVLMGFAMYAAYIVRYNSTPQAWQWYAFWLLIATGCTCVATLITGWLEDMADAQFDGMPRKKQR